MNFFHEGVNHILVVLSYDYHEMENFKFYVHGIYIISKYDDAKLYPFIADFDKNRTLPVTMPIANFDKC